MTPTQYMAKHRLRKLARGECTYGGCHKKRVTKQFCNKHLIMKRKYRVARLSTSLLQQELSRSLERIGLLRKELRRREVGP
jgi:hypothetical protein